MFLRRHPYIYIYTYIPGTCLSSILGLQPSKMSFFVGVKGEVWGYLPMARGQNHENVEEMRNITCDMLSILVALDIYMLGVSHSHC